MITGILATIGGVVVGILALIALYFIIAISVTISAILLHRLGRYVFYRFGGKADMDEYEYRPPRPPWDRVRYEIYRITHHLQVIQRRMRVGVQAKRAVKPSGLDKLYKQREEHYGNDD